MIIVKLMGYPLAPLTYWILSAVENSWEIQERGRWSAFHNYFCITHFPYFGWWFEGIYCGGTAPWKHTCSHIPEPGGRGETHLCPCGLMLWHLLAGPDALPPPHPRPKQHQQLETKCSNIRVCISLWRIFHTQTVAIPMSLQPQSSLPYLFPFTLGMSGEQGTKGMYTGQIQK